MGAIARTRALHRHGNPGAGGGVAVGDYVAAPALAIEIGGEKPAGVVYTDRINPERVLAA